METPSSLFLLLARISNGFRRTNTNAKSSSLFIDIWYPLIIPMYKMYRFVKITIIDTYYSTLKMFLSIDIHDLSLTMDYFFMRLQRTSFFSTTWNCNHEVLNLSSLSFWNLHLNLLIFNKTLIFCRKNVIDYLSNSYFDRTFHYLECKLLQLGKGGMNCSTYNVYIFGTSFICIFCYWDLW